MLFRYKISKLNEHFCEGVNFIRYEVQIQKYNINSKLFRWKTCKDTSLKSIVELLGSEYCFSRWDNALQEIHETIAKYGSVDRMIEEYIRKFIITDMQLDKEMNNLEKSIDDLVLTGNWNAIEIKENE